MKPITFEGSNTICGADQPEYLPLPCKRVENGLQSCWQLSFKERVKILFTGRIFLTLLTFGKAIQPSKLEV
jgi:hypothetical protein